MSDDSGREVLATIQSEISEKLARADAESDPVARDRMRRQARLRAEIAEEEAAAIAAEGSENQQAALSLRVPASLAAELKARADAEHVPTSVLVRRLLTEALHAPTAPVLTVEQVEQIARRILREPA